MARVDLTQGAINSRGANGFQEATATFDTLVLGADNGVNVPWYGPGGYVALKNGTVGAAEFTIKTFQSPAYVQHGLVVPDETYSVGADEIFQAPFSGIFKQPDNMIYIDCDVAGEVAIVTA